MKYRFDTLATMKPYNREKWFICKDIVGPIIVDADDLKSALSSYREKVQDRDYIKISDTALRKKTKMFRTQCDGTQEQIGYVITGKTEFPDYEHNGWTEQYIDLWVTIYCLSLPAFYAF